MVLGGSAKRKAILEYVSVAKKKTMMISLSSYYRLTTIC